MTHTAQAREILADLVEIAEAEPAQLDVCLPLADARAILEALSTRSEDVERGLELLLFRELIKRGIDEDAADQASQAAIAAMSGGEGVGK